jgi:hypothetical protein
MVTLARFTAMLNRFRYCRSNCTQSLHYLAHQILLNCSNKHSEAALARRSACQHTLVLLAPVPVLAPALMLVHSNHKKVVNIY